MPSKTAKYKAKVTAIKKLNNRVTEFSFKYISPEELMFEPGQFITVYVADKTLRTYSISSDYKNIKTMSITVSLIQNGIGSTFLTNLKIGDEITFMGPSGFLRIKEPLAENLHFFASGTGIAPFMPMFYKLADTNFLGNIKLYFGVRNIEDLFYFEELKKLKSTMKSFSYQIYLSDNTINVDAKLEKDFYRGYLNPVAETLHNPNDHYYLCGHPLMVAGVEEQLITNKIPPENIICERF